MQVTCDYCGKAAHLVDSAAVYGGRSYGLIWHCRPCRAWVGVHQDSAKHAPLGRLANAELRYWKMRAHAAFDPLWKSGRMSRRDAYCWLQDALGVDAAAAHIGKFDVAQCREVVVKVDAYLNALPAMPIEALPD